MKILILGAGAIGGYVGGRLQQSGADITFLVRPARQKAIERDGLAIKSTKGDVTQKVKTVLKAEDGSIGGGPYDLVLLTPKAYDLDSAIAAVAPAVGPGTTIVPLLNGMRHLDVLDARFGKDKVVGGLARVGVAMSPDGVIHHTSPFAAISFGEREAGKPPRKALVELDAAIKQSGIDGGLNPNIVQDLWDKWIMLCSLASTNCLMRGSSGDILEADEGRAIVMETVDECRKVAAAAGHDPGEKGMQTIRSFLTVKGSKFTASMLHDLEKGSMVEADHIVGDMIARAKKAAIPTPLLRVAYAHLQVYLHRRPK
ncbi:MAG TPA: ketopantoate reductase family protein [Reyranella sp.]|nr:ketopantoate reductase family protein [Reyranella sp.]